MPEAVHLTAKTPIALRVVPYIVVPTSVRVLRCRRRDGDGGCGTRAGLLSDLQAQGVMAHGGSTHGGSTRWGGVHTLGGGRSTRWRTRLLWPTAHRTSRGHRSIAPLPPPSLEGHHSKAARACRPCFPLLSSTPPLLSSRRTHRRHYSGVKLLGRDATCKATRYLQGDASCKATLLARRRYLQGDATCKATLLARRRYLQGDAT